MKYLAILLFAFNVCWFHSDAAADVPVDLILLIERERTPPAPITPTTIVPTPVPAQPPVAARLGYPVRSGWWTGCPGWNHMTQGQHAGKFDPVWLTELSWAELQSLHSDDHEGRVKWTHVKRPAAIRLGGRYEWRCDGQSCGWHWVPDREGRKPVQPRRVFR